MTPSDKQFLDRLKSELDSDLEKIDDATLAQLALNRRTALSGRSPRPPLVIPFAPAFAFVATAVVFAVLLRVPGAPREAMDANIQLIEFSLAVGEMELVDDLEFFRWLDTHGNAG